MVLAPWAVRGPCSRLAWFRTLNLHHRYPAENARVPEPDSKRYGLKGVWSTRSRHEHTDTAKLRGNTSWWWPHPQVRTSPEVGPGATVGTPGLGYPLLLCLGKGLCSYP